MAPEILLCMDYSEQVDVFSYGMVLCELLSRKQPNATYFKRMIPGFGIDPVNLFPSLPSLFFFSSFLLSFLPLSSFPFDFSDLIRLFFFFFSFFLLSFF